MDENANKVVNDTEEKEAKKKKVTKTICIVAFIILVIVIIILFMTCQDCKGKSKDGEKDATVEAIKDTDSDDGDQKETTVASNEKDNQKKSDQKKKKADSDKSKDTENQGDAATDENGSQNAEASGNNAGQNADTNSKDSENKETEVNNAAETENSHEHDFEEVSKEPATCEKDGKIVYQCSCGEKREETITKLTHFYEETENIEPSCISAGVVRNVCRNCGDVREEYPDALGHDYTVAPCTDHTHKYTCSRCGDSYEENCDIGAEMHGNCKICNQFIDDTPN